MTEANGDSGSKDRATVALAVEKIDGLKALTAAGFSEVHRRLDAVEGVPVQVAAIQEHDKAQDARLDTLEQAAVRRQVHGPTLALGVFALVVSIAAAIAAYL